MAHPRVAQLPRLAGLDYLPPHPLAKDGAQSGPRPRDRWGEGALCARFSVTVEPATVSEFSIGHGSVDTIN